ncbi:hypothetical protein BN1723_020264, partial [Verticillium longisporum]
RKAAALLGRLYIARGLCLLAPHLCQHVRHVPNVRRRRPPARLLHQRPQPLRDEPAGRLAAVHPRPGAHGLC